MLEGKRVQLIFTIFYSIALFWAWFSLMISESDLNSFTLIKSNANEQGKWNHDLWFHPQATEQGNWVSGAGGPGSESSPNEADKKAHQWKPASGSQPGSCVVPRLSNPLTQTAEFNTQFKFQPLGTLSSPNYLGVSGLSGCGWPRGWGSKVTAYKGKRCQQWQVTASELSSMGNHLIHTPVTSPSLTLSSPLQLPSNPLLWFCTFFVFRSLVSLHWVFLPKQFLDCLFSGPVDSCCELSTKVAQKGASLYTEVLPTSHLSTTQPTSTLESDLVSHLSISEEPEGSATYAQVQ